MLTPSERPEEEDLDLVGGEDLVLEQAEEDCVVSLVERSRARTKVVSFFSNHTLGTVLPLLRWMVSGEMGPGPAAFRHRAPFARAAHAP
jgi:hypothetical protein